MVPALAFLGVCTSDTWGTRPQAQWPCEEVMWPLAQLEFVASGTPQGDVMPSNPWVLRLQGSVKGFGQAGGQGTVSQRGTRERTGPCVWSHTPRQAVTSSFLFYTLPA